MENTEDYLYRIYKMTDHQGELHGYASEGPGTINDRTEYSGPLIDTSLDEIIKGTVRDHLYYLNDKGLTGISKESDLYMAFSFVPPYQMATDGVRMYRTKPLNETEQDHFFTGIGDTIKSLGDMIHMKQNGNPIE